MSLKRATPTYWTWRIITDGHFTIQTPGTFSPWRIAARGSVARAGYHQGEFADRLGVSRRTVSEILHERRPVMPDMAIRLGKLLGNGAGLWLRMQQAVDVWTLEQQGDYAHMRLAV